MPLPRFLTMPRPPLARLAPLALFRLTLPSDLDHLVALRITAMRPSLEQIGRFDPQRARERFTSGFVPEVTFHIMQAGQAAGFFVLERQTDRLRLRHLYLHPDFQHGGLGAQVLRRILADARRHGCSVQLAALRDSPANAFYQRHGFVQAGEGEWDILYEHPRSADATAAHAPEAGVIRWLEPADLPALDTILRQHVRDLPDGSVVETEIAAIRQCMNGERDADGRYRSYLVARDAQGVALGCMALSGPDARISSHLALDTQGQGSALELLNVFVHRDAMRGRGIGRALLQAACDEARAAGATKLVVNSGPRYRPSWGFYDHLFDASHGMMMDYYGAGRHAKVWSMAL